MLSTFNYSRCFYIFNKVLFSLTEAVEDSFHSWKIILILCFDIWRSNLWHIIRDKMSKISRYIFLFHLADWQSYKDTKDFKEWIPKWEWTFSFDIARMHLVERNGTTHISPNKGNCQAYVCETYNVWVVRFWTCWSWGMFFFHLM